MLKRKILEWLGFFELEDEMYSLERRVDLMVGSINQLQKKAKPKAKK